MKQSKTKTGIESDHKSPERLQRSTEASVGGKSRQWMSPGKGAEKHMV